MAGNDTNDSRELEHIARLIHEGRAWVRRYPEAWRAGEACALERAARNHPVSWHEVAAAMTARDYTDHESGAPVSLDNTLGPLFMRWLRAAHPELHELVRPRRSVFDLVNIGSPYDRG